MDVIKVGIIDDDGSKVTQIMTYLLYGMKDAPKQKADKYSNMKFEVFEIPLSVDMNDITEYITNEKIDALLIDYNLTSYETVPYTGVQLARYIQEKFMGFPLFILTSYEDELYEQEVFDVYQIFDFERYLSEPQERIELHYKLIQQVAKYRKQLELWKKEIENLIPKKGQSAAIDNRILELDTKLEKSIDGHAAIPDEIKKNLRSNKLDELIGKIDLLLKED
jgi:hypothetical protein